MLVIGKNEPIDKIVDRLKVLVDVLVVMRVLWGGRFEQSFRGHSGVVAGVSIIDDDHALALAI